MSMSMEINNQMQYSQIKKYSSAVSDVKHTQNNSVESASNMDTVVISEEARKAAMTVERENFEVPVLQGQADSKVYDNAYIKAYLQELAELTKQVENHYKPKFSEMKDMNAQDAMNYLVRTYKMPWMQDIVAEGTELPLPPEGMSYEEADMALHQLKNMYLNHEISILRDPYALGECGIERLSNIEKYAHKAANEAYDAAQKDYVAKQEIWKAEQEEKNKKIYKYINGGNGTALGVMALQPERKTED